MNLTDRQIQLLRAIIEEYIETAQPVGSETVERKHGLAVSPATIRNEMVALTKEGYLKKPHASAGRIPTPMALKYYVHHLLETENLPVSEEVSVKQQIWDVRHKKQQLLREATRALAQKSNMLSLVVTDQGELYYAGAANILDFPEFYDIDLTRNLLLLLDKISFWQNIFRQPVGEDPFYLIVGEDFGGEAMFTTCGMLYAKFRVQDETGMIGVIGPCRLRYRRLIPMIRYFGELLTEIGR
ncbi:MAG TPA: hypothetical protein VJL83_03645 [Patescibacteria group bacterium]|nr:hypothetical protein [Patescibacteria group bacterium]